MFPPTLKEGWQESLGHCLARGEHLGESTALLCAGAGELSLASFFPSPHALPAQEGWPLSSQLLFTHLHGSSFLETFVAEHPAPGVSAVSVSDVQGSRDPPSMQSKHQTRSVL